MLPTDKVTRWHQTIDHDNIISQSPRDDAVCRMMSRRMRDLFFTSSAKTRESRKRRPHNEIRHEEDTAKSSPKLTDDDFILDFILHTPRSAEDDPLIEHDRQESLLIRGDDVNVKDPAYVQDK